MARSSRHPREVRERAVARVLESQSDYGLAVGGDHADAGKVWDVRGVLMRQGLPGSFLHEVVVDEFAHLLDLILDNDQYQSK